MEKGKENAGLSEGYVHFLGIEPYSMYTLDFYEGYIDEFTCVPSELDSGEEIIPSIELWTRMNHRYDTAFKVKLDLLDKDGIENSMKQYDYYIIAKGENSENGELERLGCCQLRFSTHN